jgi:hypothetical protein
MVTAFFGLISGPMADLGVKEGVVRVFGLKLVEAEREGRLVILYHVLAMIVVAVETYMVTGLVPMKQTHRQSVNTLVTFGYLAVLAGGLPFAYLGRNWAFHGLFISGLVLVFAAGSLLLAALWPWQNAYRLQDPAYAQTRSGYDLERIAFFTVAVAMLVSSLFGAIPGSYYGNGFQTFLAENVVREPVRSAMQRSVIGHLHIMLALIAIVCALIVCRWLDFKGNWQKLSMPLMIAGSGVLSIGSWLVVPFEEIAHAVIYGGSTLAMLGALFLVIYAWRDLIRQGMAARGVRGEGFFPALAAMVHDPLKFGATWQMVFMNFTVSFVGIFVAVKLDEIFRVWQFTDERSILTGHWHVLGTLTATILLMVYADLAGLRGRARRWFGWLLIISSDLAFGAVTVYELRRLFVEEAVQQPLINMTTILGDIGLGTLLLILAGFMLWRLADLFKRRGRWSEEAQDQLVHPHPGGDS